jgi:hypothetical protein
VGGRTAPQSSFLTDVHDSSLYNTGASGLLVVGTLHTSEADPGNQGVSVGAVDTIEEEEDEPDSSGADGEAKKVSGRDCGWKASLRRGKSGASPDRSGVE